MKRRFLEEDKMVPSMSNITRRPSHHHVAKRKQRNKALEVVFDPTSHKEYITGFRKRKQQRRKEALSVLEKRQRQQRLEERAERRQSIRQQLQLDTYQDLGEKTSPSAMNPDSKVFHHANGMTSTVTIEPIGAENDEEPLLDNFSNRDDDEEHAVGTSFKEEEQVQGVTKEASEPQRMGTKKLSKQSLKIIERTKLKIQGKHLKRTKKNTSSNEKHSRNVKRRKGRR